MNTNSHNLPLNDRRFDRLVDGELSEQQRRELLAGLDNEPGGWRSCALAFLEAQCWRESLAALWKGSEGSPHTPCADVSHRDEVSLLPSRGRRWTGHLGTLMAMAACFLVAFWIGSAVQQMHRDGSATPGTGTVQVARAPVARQTPAVPHPSQRSLAGVLPGAANPWRMVTVTAPAGPANAGSTVRVPAVERNKLDPQWVNHLPSAIPDDVMQALSRTGHQIEQHRELVPVPLEDGRQLVMPVDNVKVHYVGNETY
jgi:hypothetical protein